MSTDNTVETPSATAEERAFQTWMAKVDAAVEMIAGCSVYDLADFCFRDAYDDGRKPVSVAREVIRQEMY